MKHIHKFSPFIEAQIYQLLLCAHSTIKINM